MMKLIGICGQSGSGKSTVSKYFQEKGFPVFDCDAIYHELVNHPSECLSAIAKEFGGNVIQNGKLDRAYLRRIVFSDQSRISALNTLTHSYVLRELEFRLEKERKKGNALAFVDAPMMFESGLDRRCDLVVAVVAEEDLLIDRICRRDGLNRKEAVLRLRHQISATDLKNKCTYVIENNGDENALVAECDALYGFIMKKFGLFEEVGK